MASNVEPAKGTKVGAWQLLDRESSAFRRLVQVGCGLAAGDPPVKDDQQLRTDKLTEPPDVLAHRHRWTLLRDPAAALPQPRA